MIKGIIIIALYLLGVLITCVLYTFKEYKEHGRIYSDIKEYLEYNGEDLGLGLLCGAIWPIILICCVFKYYIVIPLIEVLDNIFDKSEEDNEETDLV